MSQMLFIIGSQKSGTTWLRNCVSHVVPISLGHEWYLPDLYHSVSEHVQSFGQAMSEEERRQAVNSSTQAAWLGILNAALPGALADKSAYPCVPTRNVPVRNDLHPYAVQIAKEVFPNGKTVVITRDPRAVYNSWLHFRKALRNRPKNSLSSAASWWRDRRRVPDPEVFARNWAIQNARWLDDNPDCFVRYEDLKENFEASLRGMFDSVGMPVKPVVLDRIYEAEYEISKGRERQPAIYRKGVIDDWKSYLTATAQRKIENAAGRVMARLGY
ncbi:MAG: hypothetical protein CVT73_23750 [Alphaproteobacteria bacterium HGW-Alphaproteobacteria-12]|nr:MAG: hypothetical protein CVT73_23750 [Alphaproteobacteria bacterium HGW-Alphaproteobacteria-12]